MADIFERLDSIDDTKPTNEIAWRRHCIVYVRPSELPPEVVKVGAWEAYSKAKAAYSKASDADYDKAWEAYNGALAAYYKALRDHAKPLLQLLNKYVPDHTWNGEELVFK